MEPVKLPRRCGCYWINKLQKETIQLPLKHIDYNITIVNSLVDITLTQKYLNTFQHTIEVQYSFPIYPNSSIYKFQAHFDNKTIQGVVKEKNQAKKQYEEAVKQGKQAAYGEIDNNSPDVMNMLIGNIPSNTEVIVTISILQQLTITMNTFFSLHIPSTISPRYMQNYPNKLHPRAQPKEVKQSGPATYTWNFKIEIKTQKKVIFFDSPTHNITLIHQNQTATQTILVMQKQVIPNKDFKLLFTTNDFQVPSYVLGRTDLTSTVMLSFIPKFCQLSIDDAYKASVEGKTLEGDIDKTKGQYIFLLDRSGSMDGRRIQKAKQALILFLKSLPNDSYFNVVSFGNGYRLLTQKNQQYNNNTLKRAIQQIKKMRADMGGTQIYAPLEYLLRLPVNNGYPRHIFLLTDGAVGGVNTILSLIQNNIKYSRIHTIGIGNGASPALIVGCAEKGKGKHIFIDDNENPSQKIIGLLCDSLSPVISEVSLKFDPKIVQSVVPNPQSIPYILKDELLNFYVTFKNQLNQECSFTFEYKDSQNKLPYSTKVIVSQLSENVPFVDKMSNYKVIKSFQSAQKMGKKIEDYMYYAKVINNKEEAIKNSIQHQILSQYTAFVCIGKELVDGKFQEYVNSKTQTIKIKQPTIEQSEKQTSGSAYLKKSKMSRCMPTSNLALSNKKCNVQTKKIQRWQQDQQQSSSSQQKEKNMRRKQEKNLVKMQQIQIKAPLKKLQIKSKQSEKKQIQNIKEREKDNISIEEIINSQKSNGSWDNYKLFDLLFIKHQIKINELSSVVNKQILLTYMIAIWIQKYYPQRQYTLLVKKAFNWVNNSLIQNGIQIDKLKQLDQII